MSVVHIKLRVIGVAVADVAGLLLVLELGIVAVQVSQIFGCFIPYSSLGGRRLGVYSEREWIGADNGPFGLEKDEFVDVAVGGELGRDVDCAHRDPLLIVALVATALSHLVASLNAVPGCLEIRLNRLKGPLCVGVVVIVVDNVRLRPISLVKFSIEHISWCHCLVF